MRRSGLIPNVVRPAPAFSANTMALSDSCFRESVNNVARMNTYTLEPIGFIRSGTTHRGRDRKVRLMHGWR